MKKTLMDILVCPDCKSPLELEVNEEKCDDVVEGSLLYNKCESTFPINESIPNLLSTPKRT